jgi:hypothetical protein
MKITNLPLFYNLIVSFVFVKINNELIFLTINTKISNIYYKLIINSSTQQQHVSGIENIQVLIPLICLLSFLIYFYINREKKYKYNPKDFEQYNS